MNNYEIIKVLESCEDLETNSQRLIDFVDMGKNIYKVEKDFEEGKRICLKGRDIALRNTRTYQTSEWYKIYILSLKYLAQYFLDFDSYMLSLEHKRDPEEQFWLVRRECFKDLGLMQAFQDMLEDKLDVLTISLAPGTGKSTMLEFFGSYVMGLYPEKCNLFSSYSGTITEMFHRSVYNIITNKEYAWSEIFPDVKMESKSDKDEYINLGKYKPFKTLTCRSINSSTTGVTRAEGFLMCDDLVSGIEEALNPERLETLYMKYVSDLKSRRKLGCKEIHIATRWSVHDPIGHLQALYDGNDRVRFIAVDCFDENGESVFNFKFNKGFTTKYFRDMEATMDDITFRCMYRSDPIEREGLLYHKEDFRYYLGGLPMDGEKIKEPDAILAICDTKDTGTDFNCLPVVYQYGQNFYLEDVVYDNGSPYVLDELNANCLVKHNVQMAQFESNKEGSRTGDQVQKLVKEKGGRCVITKKYTTTNKETKIIVNSDWVKQHILLKDPSEYEKKSMYAKFVNDVFRYVTLGKNKHDDSVDALAMLALFVQSLEGSVAEVYSRRDLGI